MPPPGVTLEQLHNAARAKSALLASFFFAVYGMNALVFSSELAKLQISNPDGSLLKTAFSGAAASVLALATLACAWRASLSLERSEEIIRNLEKAFITTLPPEAQKQFTEPSSGDRPAPS